MFWKLKPVWIVKPLTANPRNQPRMCWHLTFVSSFTSGGEGVWQTRCVRAVHCWAPASGDWLMVSLLRERCEGTVGREGKHGCELEGDVLLQGTPAVLAGVPSEITWLGEAAPAVSAAGGIAGGTAQGSGRALWARAGTVNMCWKFLLALWEGRRGWWNLSGSHPVQIAIEMTLNVPVEYYCLHECCMEKRSGVCHQSLDKPCAALPAIALVCREDSRTKISLGGRDHSIWHFKMCYIMFSSWKLCTCQQLIRTLWAKLRGYCWKTVPLQQRLL